ncbi:alpha/beta fold hydrolase [Streptomyces sp. NPDC097619]|uniref:thioesterase II family protein n=1 Tax=Streptomyces sp. NPDC097619 TaxID=3157228 RepID=UPI0033347F65
MNSKWLRQFAPAAGEGLRLVCFPHAGGSASALVPLARALGDRLDVYVVQYPGRQDRYREEPFRNIAAHADALAREIAPLASEPYAFFGHSMGAVLAHETARRLSDAGLPAPRRLFLSGRGAPTGRPSVHDRLSGDAEVLAAVTMLGGTGPAVLDDPELREMVLPALRADYAALGSYDSAPGTPLDTGITALIGDSDPVVTVAEAAAWEEHTTGDFRLEVFPGGHFYLDEHTEALSSAVAEGFLATDPQA